MKKFLFFILILTSMLAANASPSLASTAAGGECRVTSPDGNLAAIITPGNGLSLSIVYKGQTLMLPSTIGLTLGDGTVIVGGTRHIDKGYTGYHGYKKNSKPALHTETIASPFYRQKSFTESYNQLDLPLSKGFSLQVRAYNDGIAYRYVTTRKGETIIKNETANFSFGKDKKAWLPYSTTPKKPFAMAFQNIYDETRIDTASATPAFLPATVDCGAAKVTILESDLVSYPNMWVKATKDGELDALFAPYPTKMTYYPWRHMSHVAETANYIAKSTGRRSYPWRILAVTEEDTQMPVNNLVYALARPNKIGDTSWIKPGKVAWDWWNDWNLKGVDFKAGINYDTYKYYIDFAANHGIEYIVLDEGWYDSKAGTILHPIDAIQLPKLIDYANSKHVGIVLWAVFNVMDENLENICQHYADMGIKGFKVDFMDRDDQTAVEIVERLAACTAKHHLILDLHGIYKPVGLNRTYPNILNYESVFGMEESRWTELKNDMPRYDVSFPYIRMMAGQVDFTPGAMRNGTKQDWHACYTKPISMGTRCHQAACYVVQDSPFTMLADSPTNYEADEEYTNFIASLPTIFDKTVVLQGKIGEYIVTAREKDGNWYIGGQTNWDSRDITITFPFLEDGVSYKAEILNDGINADHDAEDYNLSIVNGLKKTCTLKMTLASGGGFVIKLTK